MRQILFHALINIYANEILMSELFGCGSFIDSVLCCGYADIV